MAAAAMQAKAAVVCCRSSAARRSMIESAESATRDGVATILLRHNEDALGIKVTRKKTLAAPAFLEPLGAPDVDGEGQGDACDAKPLAP
jgi:hypothetical protein